MKILFLYFLLLLPQPTQNDDWKLIKNQNDVKVYNRLYQNTRYKEVKGVTFYKGSLNSLLLLIKDSPNAPNWVSRVKEFRTVYEIDAKKWFSYTVISMPFPYSNRDLVTYNEIIEQTSESIKIRIVSIPEVVKKQDKIVRIIKAEGFWLFRKMATQEVEITYQFYSEPQIDLPKWFTEPLIANGIVTTLLKMKEAALKYENK
jgi:hypothetical protein